jgi:restriction system protein
MGRRKGELTVLMEAASKWPWQVPAGLVPVSYVGCHLLAAAFDHVAAPVNTAGFGPVVIKQGVHAFASILQYIFPLIFLVAATVSLASRNRSVRIFDAVRTNPQFDVQTLSWQDFERLVGEGFRHRGFRVKQRGGAGPDGGVDLELARGDERYLVQCKQWRAQQVGVSVVRELYGVMAAERVAGGFVVTSGSLTKDASAFAAGRNIELLDGRALDELIREGRTSVLMQTDVMTNVDRPAPPSCPQCRIPMVLRTAKQGTRKGRSFWGCAQYPKCRQIVGIGWSAGYDR